MGEGERGQRVSDAVPSNASRNARVTRALRGCVTMTTPGIISHRGESRVVERANKRAPRQFPHVNAT